MTCQEGVKLNVNTCYQPIIKSTEIYWDVWIQSPAASHMEQRHIHISMNKQSETFSHHEKDQRSKVRAAAPSRLLRAEEGGEQPAAEQLMKWKWLVVQSRIFSPRWRLEEDPDVSTGVRSSFHDWWAGKEKSRQKLDWWPGQRRQNEEHRPACRKWTVARSDENWGSLWSHWGSEFDIIQERQQWEECSRGESWRICDDWRWAGGGEELQPNRQDQCWSSFLYLTTLCLWSVQVRQQTHLVWKVWSSEKAVLGLKHRFWSPQTQLEIVLSSSYTQFVLDGPTSHQIYLFSPAELWSSCSDHSRQKTWRLISVCNKLWITVTSFFYIHQKRDRLFLLILCPCILSNERRWKALFCWTEPIQPIKNKCEA